MAFMVDGHKAFDLPLTEVQKAQIGGKGQEVQLELHQDDTTAEGADALVELKLWFSKEVRLTSVPLADIHASLLSPN